MHKILSTEPLWPDIVLSTSSVTARVSRAVAAGRLRPIGLNLYTPRLDEPTESLIRRCAWRVTGLLAPGSVVSFRTAIERRPAPDGLVFLVGSSRYDRDLPGLRLRVTKGPGALEGDVPFEESLFLASRARALLDAMRPSRRRGSVARGLDDAEVAAILERELAQGGSAALAALRDRAARLAAPLDARREYEALARRVDAMLGAHARERRDATPAPSRPPEPVTWTGGRGLL